MRSTSFICAPIVCALTFIAIDSGAQSRRRAGPSSAPPPRAEISSSIPSSVAAGTPPGPTINVQGGPTADHPRLVKEMEVRRGFHFEAFAEPQVTIVNKDWYPSRGFTLNDAALYLGKDFSHGLAAMVDLPFASTLAGTGTSVGFATSRAQAYVQWLRGPLQVKFGQYDTIYGYEKNDSRDRFFADAGTIKQWLVPVTHVGALVGYSVGDLTFRGQLTNPRDTATMANQNPEFGLQVRFDGEALSVAGGLTLSDQKIVSGTSLLVDLMASLKMDPFTGAVYFDSLKSAGFDRRANGFGVQGAYDLSPELGLGGRIEYASDFIDLTTGLAVRQKNAFAVSVGPSYRWLPDLTLRGDVDVASIHPELGESITLFGLQGSVVASF